MALRIAGLRPAVDHPGRLLNCEPAAPRRARVRPPPGESVTADRLTLDERRQIDAHLLREATTVPARCFVSDATTAQSRNPDRQVGRAMTGGVMVAAGGDHDAATGSRVRALITRNQSYAGPPSWADAMPVYFTAPAARHNLGRLQRDEHNRRIDTDTVTARTRTAVRRPNPSLLGKREADPPNEAYPYKRTFHYDTTPTRPLTTLPTASTAADPSLNNPTSLAAAVAAMRAGAHAQPTPPLPLLPAAPSVSAVPTDTATAPPRDARASDARRTPVNAAAGLPVAWAPETAWSTTPTVGTPATTDHLHLRRSVAAAGGPPWPTVAASATHSHALLPSLPPATAVVSFAYDGVLGNRRGFDGAGMLVTAARPAGPVPAIHAVDDILGVGSVAHGGGAEPYRRTAPTPTHAAVALETLADPRGPHDIAHLRRPTLPPIPGVATPDLPPTWPSDDAHRPPPARSHSAALAARSFANPDGSAVPSGHATPAARHRHSGAVVSAVDTDHHPLPTAPVHPRPPARSAPGVAVTAPAHGTGDARPAVARSLSAATQRHLALPASLSFAAVAAPRELPDSDRTPATVAKAAKAAQAAAAAAAAHAAAPPPPDGVRAQNHRTPLRRAPAAPGAAVAPHQHEPTARVSDRPDDNGGNPAVTLRPYTVKPRDAYDRSAPFKTHPSEMLAWSSNARATRVFPSMA